MKSSMFHVAARVLSTALLSMVSVGFGAQVQLKAGLATPVLLAGKKQNAYLKVGVTGLPLESAGKRAPVNIAIVLDRSGSMSGEKIEEAKRGAVLALDMLSADDIVSVVTYDDATNVLVPATKATDKEAIRSKIRAITPGGSTALFAGVSKGAEELRKFLNRERVNRVILLSDGLANVGPSTPGDLAELATTLAKDGIGVSTIGLGLGYNEDLMTRLASNSGGSHYFVEKASDLARAYDRELGRALSVVAQEAVVRIECASTIRPIRVLNRDAEISGSRVTVSLDQVYADSEKYLILEVEIPAGSPDAETPVAEVKTSYLSLANKSEEEQTMKVLARHTSSASEVEARTDKSAMESVVEQVATEKRQLAVAMRDKGQVEEAQKILYSNQAYLQQNAVNLKSDKLRKFGEENANDAQNLDDKNWNKQRKAISEGDVFRSKQ